jgi:hypothetical protein
MPLPIFLYFRVIISYSREMSTINTIMFDIFVEHLENFGNYLSYCYYLINFIYRKSIRQLLPEVHCCKIRGDRHY